MMIELEVAKATANELLDKIESEQTTTTVTIVVVAVVVLAIGGSCLRWFVFRKKF